MLQLLQNGRIIRHAERNMNDFLRMNSEEHVCGIIIVNPDGSSLELQPGFEIKDYEYYLVKDQG